MNGFCRGFSLFADGVSLFFQRKKLWKYALCPLLLMTGIYLAALWMSIVFAVGIAHRTEAYLLEQNNWLSAMAGAAAGGITVIAVGIVVTVILLTVSLFYEFLAGLFCDRMIAAFLKENGSFTEPEISLKRTLLFCWEALLFNINTLVGLILLTWAGLLLPVAGQFLLFLFAAYRMGLAWLMPAGFVSGISRHGQKQLLSGNRMKVLGFGTAAYLCWMIPLAPLVFLPGLVLGGTELFLEMRRR